MNYPLLFSNSLIFSSLPNYERTTTRRFQRRQTISSSSLRFQTERPRGELDDAKRFPPIMSSFIRLRRTTTGRGNDAYREVFTGGITPLFWNLKAPISSTILFRQVGFTDSTVEGICFRFSSAA
ncbi:hypothetical protein LINGRAPRIM_LOCUS2710 [Linum grandiflorum]